MQFFGGFFGNDQKQGPGVGRGVGRVGNWEGGNGEGEMRRATGRGRWGGGQWAGGDGGGNEERGNGEGGERGMKRHPCQNKIVTPEKIPAPRVARGHLRGGFPPITGRIRGWIYVEIAASTSANF